MIIFLKHNTLVLPIAIINRRNILDNEQNLGSIIRMHRNNKSMTLKDLSEKTGLSVSFLSEIERNIGNPSIVTLRKISRALGVSILSFTEKSFNRDLSIIDDPNLSTSSFVKDVRVTKANERIKIQFPRESSYYELLVPDFKRSMGAMYQKIEPLYDYGAPLLEPAGEKFLFVISGAMEYIINGISYFLNTGDAMYYPADAPIQVINRGLEPAEIIIVTTPPVL